MRIWCIIAITIGLVMTPSVAIADASDPGGTFWDDDGNIHERQIEAIAAANFTFGCGGDLYCPDSAVTRGQMAAFLVRAFDLAPSPTNAFDDDDSSIFEANINALAQSRITVGCGDRQFCPERPVSRGQMAAFLARALQLPPGPDRFTDVDDSQFVNDINAIAAAGITFGCNESGDAFCPHEVVARDQMASFLARALGLKPLEVAERPSFKATFTGDLLLHMPVNHVAASYARATGENYDFRPMFSAVKEIIGAADLALCHLEVPLHPDSIDLSGYPTFQGPAELADAIADTGYDGCSVASNHSFDKGVTGVYNTIEVMNSRGLGYDGMSSDAADRDTAQTYTANGVQVAHLSYADWLNGLILPADMPWLVNLVDPAVIIEDAQRAKDAGAEVVIVSLHWGSEYVVDPTPAQQSLGQLLSASAAVDLVVGHHAHVVQPVAKFGDEYVIYGMGNFLSNQLWSAQTTDGVIVTAELALRGDDWMARDVTFTPTWIQAGTYKILPTAETLNSGSGSALLRSQLLASWRRTNERINRLGADVTPSAFP